MTIKRQSCDKRENPRAVGFLPDLEGSARLYQATATAGCKARLAWQMLVSKNQVCAPAIVDMSSVPAFSNSRLFVGDESDETLSFPQATQPTCRFSGAHIPSGPGRWFIYRLAQHSDAHQQYRPGER